MKVGGYNYKYDLSLPLPVFYQAVLEMKKRLGNGKEIKNG